MKTAFFAKSMLEEHCAPRVTYPFTLRTNLPALRTAHVDAVFSAVYVPEREVAKDACVPAALSSLTRPGRRLQKSFDDPPPEVAHRILDSIESDIEGSPLRHARSSEELDDIVRDGDVALLHTIEGAHALGRPQDGATVDQLLANLEEFHRRGVCLMAPAHFYDVGIAPNIQGVPKTWYLKVVNSFRKQWAAEGNREPLPEIGRHIIDRMVKVGMLIDLTHMNPTARRDVYARVPDDTPIAMTHVGHRELADFDMNPDAEEIAEIARRKGVIGVIFLKYFLNGKNRGRAVREILDTMEQLLEDGNEQCVAWGSDFDGMTNPPNDLRSHAELPRLAAGMLERFGPDTTARILGSNLHALLRRGWQAPRND